MAFTIEQLEEFKENLESAIFSGAKIVEFGDRKTEYQSIGQMQKALEQLQTKINFLEGVKPRTIITPTVVY